MDALEKAGISSIEEFEDLSCREYSVVLHKAEEGGYWVEVLTLAGCHSQGGAVEEANAREAIDLYLETLRERGESPPNDADVVFKVAVIA